MSQSLIRRLMCFVGIEHARQFLEEVVPSTWTLGDGDRSV